MEGIIFFCANNYSAFEVSVIFGTDAFITGLHYAIAFISFAIFAFAASLWCSQTRTVRIRSATAFGFFMLFCILMATMDLPRTKQSQVWGFPVFFEAGLGICLTALVTAAHFATPPELVAITSGLLISIRSLGGSIGLALYNAIFSNGMSHLGSNIAGAVIPLGFPASGLSQLIPALVTHHTQALGNITDASPEIIRAGYGATGDTYLVGFRYVWVAGGCFSFVAIIGKSNCVPLSEIVKANEYCLKQYAFFWKTLLQSLPLRLTRQLSQFPVERTVKRFRILFS